MSSFRFLAIPILAFALVADAPGGPSEPEAVSDASWIRAAGRQRQALKAAEVDLCFVGDSLTEFWTATGKPVWDLAFHDRVCINLGLAADRTENILARLGRLDFSQAKPKTFILLAGTNNLSKEPPDAPVDVAAGVAAIVETLLKKSPTSRVLVLSILPNGVEPASELRARIRETNKLLAARFPAKEDVRVTWLDVHDAFLTADGNWKPGLTLDGTHLSLNGYDALARLLAPHLARVETGDDGPATEESERE